MQIGNPTDVKHVAHIGSDGPSADSPSWMEDFKSPQGSESVPPTNNGDSKENPENKRVSEGSSQRGSRSKKSLTNDLPELPKSTRRHSLDDGSSTAPSSPRRESSTKSRRNTPDRSKQTRQPKALVLGSDSSSRNLPDIPRKSSRKKPKDQTTRSSRSKADAPPPSVAYTSPFSDPGPNTEYVPGSSNGELTHSSSFRPLVREGDKGCNGIS
ncbi:hypothetical protein Vadar_008085 [Vaccinium darrowii]|uniref:Uncharacterized protein n=1 Tax=Vaccinium darrowii TaxID=229202 RepID=A0ACB7ZB92_9ERIC|nr:hypothetical protein Vadar_008085 [Vaccinium darrowii]